MTVSGQNLVPWRVPPGNFCPLTPGQDFSPYLTSYPLPSGRHYVIARTWQDKDEKGRFLRRTLGLAALGGATLDNEENYVIKKLFTALGAIQIENQARI